MDILHDLFCYAALFLSLKYIENIMSNSPPPKLENEITATCPSDKQHENGKQKREKKPSEKAKSSSPSKTNNHYIDKKPKLSEDNLSTKVQKSCSEMYDLNLKTSSTTTTSEIIPLYEYSLKPASSTYMLHDYSTNNTSSLGNIPDSVVLRRGPDPPANVTDDYITDQTSEFGMSSIKSSKMKYSKSSMEVHVSSATTFLLNKTDASLIGITNSDDILQYQISLAAENIKKKLEEIENSTYKTTKPRENNCNLPSTSKMLPPSMVNSFPVGKKSVSPSSDISSGSVTPPPQTHETKGKGVTHLHLMEMLTQVTMPSYDSNLELNNSMEVAMIDEHVKMNRSIHDSSMYSEYTNSDQFSNITGHAMEHLGEDELYGKEPILVNHKNLMEKRFERSPNGSMIAVLDFEVHDWNEAYDSISAGTSKD